MTENTNTIVLNHTDKSAVALVATIRAAVSGAGKYAAYVTDHKVTRETVKDHALALAVLAYPNEKPVQKKDGKRTKFGNAVQAAGAGLRSVLDKDETETDSTVNMLTKDGVKALAEMDDAALLDAIRTELAARTSA